MSDVNAAAREALLSAIAKAARETEEYSGGVGATLRDLAIAYRAVTGGAQPGNVVIEK